MRLKLGLCLIPTSIGWTHFLAFSLKVRRKVVLTKRESLVTTAKVPLHSKEVNHCTRMKLIFYKLIVVSSEVGSM
jgi:hypothetical protein